MGAGLTRMSKNGLDFMQVYLQEYQSNRPQWTLEKARAIVSGVRSYILTSGPRGNAAHV